MSYQMSRIMTALVVVLVAILVGWSIYAGNPWVPIPAVGAGIMIILLFRKGVKGIFTDERIFSVADKAAMLAFRTFAILGAVIGATFLALSRNARPDLEQPGFTLAYSVCAMLVIYYISFLVVNRKYGGKE